MATYTTTITPRLRVARPPDRSISQIASGPSRLPEFSQLVDVDLNDMPTSETTERQSTSRPSTPSTVTRSEKPADVLRALLSRLPPASPSAQNRSPSPQDPSERESDYDMSETSHATPSVAQESLRDLFSKARGDSGDTSRKPRPRRNSLDNSEVEVSPANERTRTDRKGKRRSFSDDEADQNNSSPPRRQSRSRATLQPVTMEFLRERFDNSQSSPAKPGSSSSNHDSSNETATILLNLSSSPPSPPMATSTPQQSLRISVNEEFQSNLLDENTDMQHAIEGLESYGDSSLGHPVSPAPIMQKRSKPSIDKDFRSAETPRHASRHSPSQPSSKAARTTSKYYGNPETVDVSELGQEWDTPHPDPRISKHEQSRVEISRSQSSLKVSREEDRSPNSQRHRPPHSSRSGQSPLSNASESRGGSRPHVTNHTRPASPSVSSAVSHDGEAAEVLHERERNWDSPHPVWHNPPRSVSPLPKVAESSRQRTNSFTTTPHYREGNDSLSRQRSTPSMKSPDSDSTKHRSSRHSVTPRPPERSSPTPSRSSSLHPSASTQRHHDAKHPERSPSPLPSFSKKRPGSPSISATPRKLKTSAAGLPGKGYFDPSMSAEEKGSYSRELPLPSREKSNGSSMELTSIHYAGSNSKSLSYLSSNHGTPGRQTSLRADDYGHDGETDDMRDTDFSSQGHQTPPLTPVSPPRLDSPNGGSGGQSQTSLSPKREPRKSPTMSNTPYKSLEDVSATRNTFAELTSSPSTPPRRSTPRSSKMEFKTPSPPKDLPDLPSPSDDEFESDLARTPAASVHSHANGHRTLQGMPTPKPPGGWHATPKPSRDTQMEQSDDPMNPIQDSWDDSDHGRRHPATPGNPINRFETPGTVGKTPKPPGGWVPTPGPSSARPLELDTPEQSRGLLTPMASLSKGNSFDPRTPGVPGGWLNTPAAKKSILKVRFDSESSRDGSQLDVSRNANGSPVNGHTAPQSDDPLYAKGLSTPLPTSLRSPSKSKSPGIRVLDAFGREERSREVKDNNWSRGMLRVVDAMGREVEDSHVESTSDVKLEDVASGKPSRGELLSRIRSGLDDLAGEFDGLESDEDDDHATKARIAELNAVSREARKARERLQRQDMRADGIKLLHSLPASNYSIRDRWRFYATIAFVQLLLLMFVYRLTVIYTRRYFLNTYYDPFNPDVHFNLFNSRSSRHFTDSRPWFSLISPFQFRTWHRFSHLAKDIPLYLWNLWDDDSVSQNSVWIPT